MNRFYLQGNLHFTRYMLTAYLCYGTLINQQYEPVKQNIERYQKTVAAKKRLLQVKNGFS